MTEKQARLKDLEEADRTNPKWRWVLAKKWKVSYTRVGQLDREFAKKQRMYQPIEDQLYDGKNQEINLGIWENGIRKPGQHRMPHLQRKNNSFKGVIKQLQDKGKWPDSKVTDEDLKSLKNHFDSKIKKSRKHTEESKKKISENNGRRLKKEVEESRFKDWQEADRTNPRWRWVLAEKWEVSYSTVGKVDRQYKKIAK